MVTPHTLLATHWKWQTRQVEFLRAMLSLRTKLDEAGCGHCIRTEPWIFYRFDPGGF